ncbi:hypothetical protein [Vibrio parahaemolyticus]|uniref:hypothetical protein n=1 Tax=Vibrio parahaemolyticus TaxID=670 RepID=UPI00111058AC|nr:hypothetical protein [Vibrio parahaemolyticus]TMX35033.1 hypothetical protein DA098_21370 [Vibrio parahaemolyticus]TMX78285.1 hypothetical protein DA094_11220 [Vibrio parahaemolyticus]
MSINNNEKRMSNIGVVMFGVVGLTLFSITQILRLGDFAMIPLELQKVVILASTIAVPLILAKVIDIILKDNERLTKENLLNKKLVDEVQRRIDIEELEKE